MAALSPTVSRQATGARRAAWWLVTGRRILLGWVCAVLLTGCLLVSGEQTTVDLQSGGGNLVTTFVSAEGTEVRTLAVAEEAVDLKVIAIVTVDSGDLRLELLQPDGSVAFAMEGRPDGQVTRTSRMQTDAEGRIRYRVFARGARNGSLQLLMQSF